MLMENKTTAATTLLEGGSRVLGPVRGTDLEVTIQPSLPITLDILKAHFHNSDKPVNAGN